MRDNNIQSTLAIKLSCNCCSRLIDVEVKKILMQAIACQFSFLFDHNLMLIQNPLNRNNIEKISSSTKQFPS